jgi:glycosyltransferase involved in cell wall biosynthesis
MRIGMISQWYEPEPGAAAHPTAIARALQRRGHDVQVLTGFPNYPHGVIYDGYHRQLRQLETRDGIRLLRVPSRASHDSSGLNRALTLSSFAASAAVQVGWLRNVDVCLVYLTPATVGIAARVLRRLAGVPYVLNVQDLWPESVTASGFLGDGRLAAVVTWALNRFLHGLYLHAAATVAIAPTMATMLEQRGVPATRSHVLYNWIDESIFAPATAATQRELDPERIWIMYAGGIGTVQGLDASVTALSLLGDRPDVCLALVGDGVAAPDLRLLATRLGVSDRVLFLGPRPMSAMPGLMAQADAQLVSLENRPLFRATVPSKLQSALAGGHPVVCAVAGDAADVVARSGAGLVATAGDPAAIASAFRGIADAGPVGRRAMGVKARTTYIDCFSEAVGAARLETLLEVAAAGGGG